MGLFKTRESRIVVAEIVIFEMIPSGTGLARDGRSAGSIRVPKVDTLAKRRMFSFVTLLLPWLLALSLSSDASQGDDEKLADPPAHEQFRTALQSSDSTQWVQAMGELGTLKRIAERTWLEGILREYLTAPLAQGNPERTRFILKHQVMRSEVLGEALLLEILARDSGSFQTEIRSALRQIVVAGTETRRRQLLDKAMARSTGDAIGFALLFPQILDIVASHDPLLAVGAVVEYLQAPADEPVAAVLSRSLQTFLRLKAPPPSWKEWLEQHRETLLSELIERIERSQWEACTEMLRADPTRLRDWLLLSLEDNAPASRRRLALDELTQLVQSIAGNGGESPQKIEFLRPVTMRLVAITAAGEWTIGFRLRALRALQAMEHFLKEPELENDTLRATLAEWIAALPKPAGSREARLGLEAVKAVGVLGIDAGIQLDELLDKLEQQWTPAEDELVLALLTSLGQLGPREPTVELVRRVYRNPHAKGLERHRVRAVQVLNNKERVETFSDEAKEAVRTFYSSVVADKDAGEPRRYAIIYLGNLGDPKTVPDLHAVITDVGTISEADRSAAIGAISKIGSNAAARAFRDLFRTLAAGTLRDQVRAYALVLCSKDETLEFLSEYVTEDGQPMEWFETFLAEESIAKLLDPDSTPTIRTVAAVRKRWDELRQKQCEAILARTEALAEIPAQEQGYARLTTVAGSVVGFADALAPAEKAQISVSKFGRWQDLGRHRGEILIVLAEKKVAGCLAGFRGLVVDDANGGGQASDAELFHTNAQWLLRQLQARTQVEGEKQLIAGLRALLEQADQLVKGPDGTLPARHEARKKATVELLDALQTRTNEGQLPNTPDS